jgi:hypothetical protein
MPNTSNFNWPTPADTDLVKDGAAAIRNLGNGVDTSLVDLKGGTTGQVLSKNSNTDMDFTWTAGGDITEVQAGTGISVASGTGPIPVVTNTVATTFDAAGDLVYGTGADTFTKLSLGTAGKVLTVNSGATAPVWASAPAPTTEWVLLNSGGTSLTGTSVTISSITNDELMIVIAGGSTNNTPSISVRVNSNSGSIYAMYGGRYYSDSSYSMNNVQGGLGVDDGIHIMRGSSSAGSTGDAYLFMRGLKSSTNNKVYWGAGGMTASGAAGAEFEALGGWIATTTAVTSVNIIARYGNLDAGTVYVYGAN